MMWTFRYLKENFQYAKIKKKNNTLKFIGWPSCDSTCSVRTLSCTFVDLSGCGVLYVKPGRVYFPWLCHLPKWLQAELLLGQLLGSGGLLKGLRKFLRLCE